MNIVKYIVMGIYAVVCVVLIALVLIQNKEDGGASGTVMGSSTNNFYEKNKGKTTEGKMKKATIILMILFAILTVALGILSAV